MDTPIDITTDATWSRATFAGVVGRDSSLPPDPNKLGFPQHFHDAAAGRTACPFIHPVGSKEGDPAVYFSEQELLQLDEEVKFSLVGQFVLGHPKMELVRAAFDSFAFAGNWKIGLLDGRHLLIQLTLEEDYARLFAKKILSIAGTPMKIFKWTPTFDPSKEQPIVPLWFKLPHLPHKFYKKETLFNIAQALGVPLKVDTPTLTIARPSVARICVERDVTLPEVTRLWIGSSSDGFWQAVEQMQKPYYCTHCRMFGHTTDRCFKLHPPLRKPPQKPVNQGPAPPIQTETGQPHVTLAQASPPEIRLNEVNPLNKDILVDMSEPSAPTIEDHLLPSDGKAKTDAEVLPAVISDLHTALAEDWQVQKPKRFKKLKSPERREAGEILSDREAEGTSLSSTDRQRKRHSLELKRLQESGFKAADDTHLLPKVDSLHRTRGKGKLLPHD